MSVTVACPNAACARALTVPEAALGRPARCRHCGRSFVVSRSADATASPDAARTRGGADSSTDRTEADLPPAIGRFRVLAELGSGAFGTVYRAYDPQLDREVALKVPHAELLANPRVVTRFLREAKAAANLRHPNIVPVFESGKAAGGFYIASAFIDGKPLADEIPEGGMPFRRAAAVARELAGAVGYAHEQGVVHRDIKPANVMVDRAGRPHLMDFGLASRADEGSKVTTDGAILGTPAYMAPEQAKGAGGDAAPAADQYAVGVVLYELLAGRVPFAGPAAIVIHNVLHLDPDPPSKHRPDTPADLETICHKAMAKRPEDRYASCEELADDLRRWLDGEPVSARPLGPVARLGRWGKRNPAVAGLSAAVVALLAVGVVVASSLAVAARSEARRADRAAADAVANLEATKQAEAAARAAKQQAEDEANRARAAQQAEAREKDEARAARKTADDERKAAEAERQKATTALKTAEDEKKAADAARLQADQAKAQAEKALGDLRKAQEQVDAAAYAPLIRRAAKSVEQRAYGDAQKVLGQCAEGRQGWEWQYLSQQCRPGTKASFDIPLMTRTGDPENPADTDRKIRLKPLAATFVTAPDIKGRVTGNYLSVLAGDAAGLGRYPIRSDRGDYNNGTWVMLPWPIPAPGGNGVPGARLRWLAADRDGKREVRQYEGACVVNGSRLAGTFKRADFPPGDRTVLRNAAGDLIEFRGDKPDTTKPVTIKDRDGKIGRVKAAAGYAFSDDGAWLATTSGDLFAVDWTSPDPVFQDHSEPLQAALKPKDGEAPPVIQSVAVGPGGKLVVLSDSKGRISIYTRGGAPEPLQDPMGTRPRPVAGPSPQGGTPEPLQHLMGTWLAAPVVRFGRDGRRIAFVSGTTGPIHVVEADTAEILVTLNNGGAKVLDFQFSNNDRDLIAVTADGTAKFWLTTDLPGGASGAGGM